MPAVTRELSIAYGGLTMGGSSDYLIDGPYEIAGGYETITIRWRVLVASATESGFGSGCSAVESAMRTINGSLTITLGSTTLLSLSHSSGTGYLARPEFRVLEDIQTGRSRLYECSVSARRPADASGKSLLRNASVEVVRSASGNRVLRVAGTYTCNGATGARATYEANVATYIGTLTTALTGTWNRSGDSAVTIDDEDKEARFQEVYREVTYNEAVGLLDNASIVDQRLAVSVLREAPGDAEGASRWVRVSVSYSCAVDRAQTTDLVSLYEGTIRPHLLDQAASAAGGSVAALLRDSPAFDRAANGVAASIECLVRGTSSVIELTVTTSEDEDYGRILVPVHGDDPHARIELRGPANRVRTVTADRVRVGAAPSLSAFLLGLGGGEGYVPLSRSASVRELRIGLPEASTSVTVETGRVLMVYATQPPSELSEVAPGDGGSASSTVPRS